MQDRGAFSRVLAIFGTFLVFSPFLIMILTSVSGLITHNILRVDYLIPGELFFVVLPGVLLLLWAALRASVLRTVISVGLGAIVVFLLATQAYAVISGLASGAVEAEGVLLIIANILFALYSLSIIFIGIAGIILIKRLFNIKQPDDTE